MKNQGWSVRPKFRLPKSFTLEEDAEFLYLLHDGNKVAIFTTSAEPNEILKVCKVYSETLEERGVVEIDK